MVRHDPYRSRDSHPPQRFANQRRFLHNSFPSPSSPAIASQRGKIQESTLPPTFFRLVITIYYRILIEAVFFFPTSC
jgi:hypothetical protein